MYKIELKDVSKRVDRFGCSSLVNCGFVTPKERLDLESTRYYLEYLLK
jgi:hypothetical protein